MTCVIGLPASQAFEASSGGGSLPTRGLSFCGRKNRLPTRTETSSIPIACDSRLRSPHPHPHPIRSVSTLIAATSGGCGEIEGQFTTYRDIVTAADGCSYVARRWKRIWKPPRWKPSRLDCLIVALGGPSKTARYLGIHRATLYRLRTGEYLVSAEMAERMKEAAVRLSRELDMLVYELTSDAAAGKQRLARARARGSNVLFEARERRARAALGR
jgi:hypothetical protein